jgi:hypothetical protein
MITQLIETVLAFLRTPAGYKVDKIAGSPARFEDKPF